MQHSVSDRGSMPSLSRDVSKLNLLSTIDQGWSRCWGRLRPSPTIYIQTKFVGYYVKVSHHCHVQLKGRQAETQSTVTF
jgi:hypothetical protein